jgi:sialate O-acetylesterase
MQKIAITFLVIAFTMRANAQVKLPKLISDSMVLQRSTKINIWGWASPNEKVTVTFKQKKYEAVTNQQGKWFVTLAAMQAGGPYNMKIDASNHIEIKNILIGDVWLCSGQSNMELEMVRVKYKYPDEISKANNTFIRQFTVPDKYDFNQPHYDVDYGSWVSINPKSILQFSAVAYFFAKEIYAKYKVPIGLINSALGGSPAESWISEEALKKFPAYYNEAQKFKRNSLIDSIETKDRNASNAWYKQLNEQDEGIKNNWKDISVDDADWQQMNVPGYWADTKAGLFNGVVWFRKEFTVPASMLNKNIKLELGRIVDADSVFINGKFVGNTTYQYPPRRYEFSSNILHEGKNIISIKLINNGGRGGFVLDKRYEITTATDTIDLKGLWKFKTGGTMPPTPSQTFVRWKPVGLYNYMIAPLINYPIKGVIWYQGEANTKNPKEYKDLMETLITDWRSKWNNNFPFLFVQLANFMDAKPQPTESSWAATRQAQLNTLSVSKTAMAVTIDIGDWNDIHPENKKDVGHRLALHARKIAYGEKNIVASGPLYQSLKKDGNKIVINFSNVGSGLMVKGNELKYFAIATSDKKFVWAKAKIENNKVIVWSDEIKDPVAVRYAWADNPDGANLYNKEGLPASPFEAYITVE